MAGGDHDAARCAQFLDVVGNRGRRHVVVRQQHRNPRGGNDLGNGARGMARQEARVVADNDAALCFFVLEHVAGNRSRNAAHVMESDIVGNKAAPAVGTELDVGHSPSLVVSRSQGLANDERPSTNDLYTSFFSFFSSRCFTTLPTSWDWSSVVTSSASSVSPITRLLTPTRATNLPGA